MRRRQVSIRTTIALTVVGSMVLGFTAEHLVRTGLPRIGVSRQEWARRQNARLFWQLPFRVATLVQSLDAIPAAERPAVIAAAQRPQLRFQLLDNPLPELANNRSQAATELLRRRIDAAVWPPRSVVVGYRPPSTEPRSEAGDRTLGNGTFVEVALLDGHWLLISSPLNAPALLNPARAGASPGSFALWLGPSLLLGLLLSMLAARWLAKPLSELTTAVDQLGGSADAPPINPRGPREVRLTIEAFNRMQERLQRFIEDRTRMIAAMSHDLRTPLTRLQLRAELVQDADHQKKMLADLSIMGEMVESILSFARDDAKQEPRSLVDLSALVEGICEDAYDAGEPVTFSGPRNVTISCRPAGLRRAISNLVDNAVKYGKSAAVELIPEAERVVIAIDDEGPGISRSERAKVFEPFYRIERSRNPETGGVGLGLSVTRSIVWEHGGDIILANRRGGGLSVRLELPAGLGTSFLDHEKGKSKRHSRPDWKAATADSGAGRGVWE